MGYTVLFGGTFNPPHNAHVKIAETVVAEESVDRLIIIPDRFPPHKSVDKAFPSGEDRMNMCKLAFSDIKKVEFSDIELKRDGKSYSIDTINELSYLSPMGLLIGGDMLNSFEKWFKYEEILKKVTLFVAARDDFKIFVSSVEKLKQKGANIKLLDFKEMNVSSSSLRKNADFDQVPVAVNEYIQKNGLYR